MLEALDGPAIGLSSAMEIRLISLAVGEPLGTAHDDAPPESRELVVVRVSFQSDDGYLHDGWGECSALNRPTYTDEFARGSFAALSSSDTGPLGPMARAALEMAQVDATLKAIGRGPQPPDGEELLREIPAGAALGLAPIDVLAERATELGDAGYRRIKVKIQPGHCDAAVAVVREAAPHAEIHVDGNGAFSPRDLPILAALPDLDVRAIEQPFAVDEVDSAARLVAAVKIPIVADEAINSIADAERLRSAGALSGVSIKAPKLGGLEAAWEMLAWCAAHGIAATAGGMLECGLGRHALARLAAHPSFTLAGDVSPARRWLSVDPWPDLTMVEGMLAVPQTDGVAPGPDLDVLDSVTLERRVVDRRTPTLPTTR